MNNFRKFCKLVADVDLTSFFSGNEGGKVTIFVPTNAAFDGVDLDEMPVTTRRNIVLTHLTAGSITAESLVCGQDVKTLLGMSVSTTQCFEATLGKAQVGFFNDESTVPMILSPNDMELCNGLVQPINNLIRVINF